MKEQWTDERIQKRYDELNAIAPGYPDLNLRDVAREIRDDLQQRSAELERLERELEATKQSLHEWQADYELLSQARDRVVAMLPSAEVRQILRRALVQRGVALADSDAGLDWLQSLESN